MGGNLEDTECVFPHVGECWADSCRGDEEAQWSSPRREEEWEVMESVMASTGACGEDVHSPHPYCPHWIVLRPD